jgi:hypothetical protein
LRTCDQSVSTARAPGDSTGTAPSACRPRRERRRRAVAPGPTRPSSRRVRGASARSASISRRVATAISQPRGFTGTPSTGHCCAAAISASCVASSARSKRPWRRATAARTWGANSRRSRSLTALAQRRRPSFEWRSSSLFPVDRERNPTAILARGPQPAAGSAAFHMRVARRHAFPDSVREMSLAAPGARRAKRSAVRSPLATNVALGGRVGLPPPSPPAVPGRHARCPEAVARGGAGHPLRCGTRCPVRLPGEVSR